MLSSLIHLGAVPGKGGGGGRDSNYCRLFAHKIAMNNGRRVNLQCIVCYLFSVSVGYEYETCSGLILWEKRTVTLQGFELDASNLGGWSLDKHHILNTQSGKYSAYELNGIKHFSSPPNGNYMQDCYNKL